MKNQNESKEYVYIDSCSVHLIKIITRNRNILKDLIIEKDEEIELLKAQIKDFEDKYNSIPAQSNLEKSLIEDKPVKSENEGYSNNELIQHLDAAERVIEYYKNLIMDLHSEYNFPPEVIQEIENDIGTSNLNRSFNQGSKGYNNDEMDTDPNNILDTSFDEYLPVKNEDLEVSASSTINLMSYFR